MFTKIQANSTETQLAEAPNDQNSSVSSLSDTEFERIPLNREFSEKTYESDTLCSFDHDLKFHPKCLFPLPFNPLSKYDCQISQFRSMGGILPNQKRSVLEILQLKNIFKVHHRGYFKNKNSDNMSIYKRLILNEQILCKKFYLFLNSFLLIFFNLSFFLDREYLLGDFIFKNEKEKFLNIKKRKYLRERGHIVFKEDEKKPLVR